MAFFLAHPDKLAEKVPYFSETLQEERERLISPNELLTWAESLTVEVNPHGTSQYCSRCGAKGERFSYRGGKRITAKWGKLFCCPVCHYVANADFDASVNVHRSFYREWHWQPRTKPPPHRLRESQPVIGGARSLRL